jgi:hypothetical protein
MYDATLSGCDWSFSQDDASSFKKFGTLNIDCSAIPSNTFTVETNLVNSAGSDSSSSVNLPDVYTPFIVYDCSATKIQSCPLSDLVCESPEDITTLP